MNFEEHMKGIIGLIAIWASWFVGHLSILKEGASIVASLAAIVASIFYARYYWHKTRKEKNSDIWKSNGRSDN